MKYLISKLHQIDLGSAFKTILSCLLATLIIANPTNALSDELLDFYDLNGIYYYNPAGTGSFGSGCFGAIGSNMNYSGEQIFSDAIMDRINTFMPYYKDAADAYDFPWQILAVLHNVESTTATVNPPADSDGYGEGIFQMYSYRVSNQDLFRPGRNLLDSDGTPNEYFVRQVQMAAERVANNYGAGLDLNTPEGIKQMFLNYNGTGGGRYKAKAEALGYSETYEGSPYVMNRYDAQRDPASPEMNSAWPGMYVGNGKYDSTYRWMQFGAYVKFEALAGPAGDTGGGSFCSSLLSGGLTEAGAQSLMDEYIQLQEDYKDCSDAHASGGVTFCSPYHIQKTDCTGGPLSNCVAFSQYFINRYTTYSGQSYGIGGLPNGSKVVSRLISYGFQDGGTIPRVYAIFSIASGAMECPRGSGIKCGHTGVILGIDEEAGIVYTGEASCSNTRDWTGVKTHSLESMTNAGYTYAYTDNILLSGGL